MDEAKIWLEFANIVVRYPNELFIDEPHAQKAIEYAEKLVSWAEEIVAENQ